jgi:tetratricopeptide (TPR) repeat protein
MNAITLHPNSPVLRYLLGLVFIQQKEFDSAAETFKKAISIKPDYDDAYLNLGIAQRTSQKLPEAIVSFEKAIDIFPGNLRAYLNLAVTLEMAQENQRAVDTYEKCLTIREDSAEIHFMLGSLQARLYREGQTVSDDRPENAKHAAQAREHLQRSLDLDPSQSEIPDMLNKLK